MCVSVCDDVDVADIRKTRHLTSDPSEPQWRTETVTAPPAKYHLRGAS